MQYFYHKQEGGAVTAKQLDAVIDNLLREAESEPLSKRRLNALVREWVATKRDVEDLRRALRSIEGRRAELSDQLTPIVRELKDQELRVDKIILRLQQRTVTPSYKSAFGKAVELLASVSEDLKDQAEKYLKDITQHKDYLKMEAGLVQRALGWVKSLSRKLWSWLRTSEGKITELERAVVFGEE